MSPSDAYREAHERILRCTDMLRLLTMALDGGADAIGPNEREAIATGTQRALDEVRAARECFAKHSHAEGPVVKRRKAKLDFARMRVDIKRAEDCFAGIRILCDTLPEEFAADRGKLRLIQALSGSRILALEAEISLGAAERIDHETLYPPRY